MGELVGYYGFVDKNSKGFLVSSAGGICSEEPFWDWLLNDHADTKQFKRVCYDLDAFVAVVLRLGNLTKDEGEVLVKRGKLHAVPYDLVYYPSKFFSISKGIGWGRPWAGFFDISQYHNCPSLDLEPSVKTCIAKAKEARNLGAEVSHTLHALGLSGDVLTSPIRSMEKSILANLDLPTHLNVPPEVNNLALQSCKGNWVSAYTMGHFEHINDYDINSAYASELAKLLDTRRGRWIQSKERPQEALYGFAECFVDITAPFSPILWSSKKDNGESRFNLSPIGPRDDVLTLEQMDFLKEYHQGEYEITGTAWWWLPTGSIPYQPLKGVVAWLHNQRKTETPLERKILKRCLAGLWGRTLSVRGKEYAESFFPVWGALVEANTSLAVAKFCLDNELSPLHIAVDGVLACKSVAFPQSDIPGSWRVSHIGNAIVISSGICAVEGKEAEGDFSLNYEWLKNALEAKPRAKEYRMVKVSPYTLAKALNTDFSRLGEVEEITRSIVIGEEAKRLYPKLPRCGGDLLKHRYPSEPIDTSMALCLQDKESLVEV